MKILIIQLARLGDIYISWPGLRALRRKFPDAKIDVLTRGRFKDAFNGLEAIDDVVVLDAKKILTPLIQMDLNLEKALSQLTGFLDELAAKEYTHVYNLTFSPVSSYLTHHLETTGASVTGYTRFDDGYLNLPDDISAYFYAQVGTERHNRFHLIEIFASLMKVDLNDEDFRPPFSFIARSFETPDNFCLVHIGASETQKSFSDIQWVDVIREFCKQTQFHFVLIGTENETVKADKIMSDCSSQRVINLVGKTQLIDLFPLLTRAFCLIGVDSAPMHMATLNRTRCFNFSVGNVNFWETGPRSPKSIVYPCYSLQDFDPNHIGKIFKEFCEGHQDPLEVYSVTTGTPSYTSQIPTDEFEWNLIQALYLEKDFPAPGKKVQEDAIHKLYDINQLILGYLEQLKTKDDPTDLLKLIGAGENIIQSIERLVPSISPLIKWYEAEKTRIGPAPFMLILEKTTAIHTQFQRIIELYVDYNKGKELEII